MDCSRATAKMSLEPKDQGDSLQGLTPGEAKALDVVFWDTYVEKYPVIHLLQDSAAGGEGCPSWDALSFDRCRHSVYELFFNVKAEQRKRLGAVQIIRRNAWRRIGELLAWTAMRYSCLQGNEKACREVR